MLRTLLRTLLVLVIVVAAAAFFLGYRFSVDQGSPSQRVSTPEPSQPAGSTGKFDAEKARQTGAKIAERAAEATNRAAEALDDASLTGKIKAKMALDDYVKARTIDVDTTDGVVTLTGTVQTQEERQRAVRLAKETAGVRSVVDRLKVR